MGASYESEYTKKLREYLDGVNNRKPADYTSEYTQKEQNALDTLTNRKAFSYDVNEDALYQQMKDNYISQGKLAMRNTMGQAATLTGGYGNSYAQQAGQQAYQGYLRSLNDNLPEYYQQALNAYTAEGDRLKDNYNLMANLEGQDYDRYQDAYNQWLTERNNAQSSYESNREYDYGVNQDNASLAQAQVDYLLSIGITPNDELLNQAGYNSQYVQEYLNRKKKSSGGSGGSELEWLDELSAYDEKTLDVVDELVADLMAKGYNHGYNPGASPAELLEKSNRLSENQKDIAKEYLNEILKTGILSNY